MRAFELHNLTEAKIIKIDNPRSRGSDYIIYKNPQPREVKLLLDKFNELRGSVELDGGVYVWEAYKATHTDAQYETGSSYWDFDFVLSTHKAIDDKDWDDLERVGKYFYSDEKRTPVSQIKNRLLMRILQYLASER